MEVLKALIRKERGRVVTAEMSEVEANLRKSI